MAHKWVVNCRVFLQLLMSAFAIGILLAIKDNMVSSNNKTNILDGPDDLHIFLYLKDCWVGCSNYLCRNVQAFAVLTLCYMLTQYEQSQPLGHSYSIALNLMAEPE